MVEVHWVDHVRSEYLGRVLTCGLDSLTSEAWVGFQQLLDGFTCAEFVQDQFRVERMVEDLYQLYVRLLQERTSKPAS